ncbi:BON domain-containing protein [Paraburkholderia sp. CNPSo 3076]|uniref:BON domain-containing protein n=1 Tax=Paraburkholderia sp. CNPSo 3076 TaxID=2940936 RepID=UPI002253DE16|nr:BON domain-containing protein [Paraburkholderia sp. CNPSo 3076]MCX5543171.1 BON domain-containing protein [Paraburkholderia sp. CNPSo 3076]
MTIRQFTRFATLLLFAFCANVWAQGASDTAATSVATGASVAGATEPTDKQLAADVRHALHAARKQGLKSTYIRVRAHNGAVTLTGVVASDDQIALATSVARGVNGVRSVTSKIEIRANTGLNGNQ